MPRPYSLEGPARGQRQELTEKIREQLTTKPRLTFVWPTSKERKEALEQVKSRDRDSRKIAEMLGSNDFVVQWVATELIPEVGISGEEEEIFLASLERIAKNEHRETRLLAAKALGYLGEKALPFLWTIARSNDEMSVCFAAYEAIERITKGNKGGNIEDQSSLLETSELGEEDQKGYSSLLATRKPLFATPDTKFLLDRLNDIQLFYNQLREELGNEFIGIVIHGSTSKGYVSSTSDIDCCIIGRTQEAAFHARKLIRHYFPESCVGYIEVREDGETEGDLRSLYSGLFFGNASTLRNIQKATFDSLDEGRWEKIRRKIFLAESYIEKAGERLNIKKKGMTKIRQISALLRVPPPYEETKRILERRAGKTEKT